MKIIAVFSECSLVFREKDDRITFSLVNSKDIISSIDAVRDSTYASYGVRLCNFRTNDKYRGCGYGKLLLSSAIKEITFADHIHLTAKPSSDGIPLGNLVSLYASVGFIPTSETDHSVFMVYPTN
jgi:predicted GNAT family N-acyltransferase